MAQKKTRDDFKIIVTALCVIAAVSFTAIVYSIQVVGLQNQINDLQDPRLVNVSLEYSDNGQGIVHVTGYIYNTGAVAAYGCHLDVKLYRNGMVADSSSVPFGKDLSLGSLGGQDISGKTAAYIDANVSYTGNPPTNVTLTLGWITPWQIPVP